MELFFVALLTVLLYKGVRFLRLSGPQRGGRTAAEDIPEGTARWYGPGAVLVVRGHAVPGGLLYVGDRLPDYSGRNDACLVNPGLDAVQSDSPAPRPSGPLTYERISPELRGEYLSWLSGGRKDPDASMACVLLFFYGLERRMFLDGGKRPLPDGEREEILAEVRRLRDLYGAREGFRGVAENFIAMDWALRGAKDPIPGDVDFSRERCAEPFLAVVAAYTARGRPIPGDVAFQWLLFHSRGPVPPVMGRSPLFRSLFLLRYGERYGQGLVISPSRVALRLSYRGASPSLGDGVPLRTSALPNPFILKTPFHGVERLAVECAAELAEYHRALEGGVREDSPEAIALLPRELFAVASAGEKARSTLESLCREGPALVETETLFKAVGKPLPEGDGVDGAIGLLRPVVSSLGFGIAPDPLLHGMKPRPGFKVALYGTPPKVASPEFAVLVPILRLGALVAQASRGVDPSEEAVLRNVVASSDRLDPAERRSMEAFLLWCLATPQDTRRLKGALKRLPEEEKDPLCRILVAVASADGRVDAREMKLLGELYDYLGLGRERAASDVHRAAVGGRWTRKRAPEEGFALDRELIRIRQEETRRVRGVLRTIFEEDGPPPAKRNRDLSRAPHRDLLVRVAGREAWGREEFRSLCGALGLLPDGAMEVLNEWGFAAAGLPLLEDGDPVIVDVILAKEVIARGQKEDPHPAP